jgi:hypothetical protein
MEWIWALRRGSDAMADRADLFRFLSAARVGGPVRLMPEAPRGSSSLERPLASSVWLPTRYDVRL